MTRGLPWGPGRPLRGPAAPWVGSLTHPPSPIHPLNATPQCTPRRLKPEPLPFMQWYHGRLAAAVEASGDAGPQQQQRVEYDDGTEELLDLSTERVIWLAATTAAGGGGGRRAGAAAATPWDAEASPVRLRPLPPGSTRPAYERGALNRRGVQLGLCGGHSRRLPRGPFLRDIKREQLRHPSGPPPASAGLTPLLALLLAGRAGPPLIDPDPAPPPDQRPQPAAAGPHSTHSSMDWRRSRRGTEPGGPEGPVHR